MFGLHWIESGDFEKRQQSVISEIDLIPFCTNRACVRLTIVDALVLDAVLVLAFSNKCQSAFALAYVFHHKNPVHIVRRHFVIFLNASAFDKSTLTHNLQTDLLSFQVKINQHFDF
jgi:hypothetical protein